MTIQPFVLYLHGFLSSPRSQKARQTLRYCEEIGLGKRIVIPQMNHGPAETISQLRALIKTLNPDQLVLMGSSLGGYYAIYLSQLYGAPAVLINPAIKPYELWGSYLGENRNYYSDEVQLVTDQHIDELRKLEVLQLAEPSNFKVFLQAGDETLDYRQAIQKFRTSQCVIRVNGSHSYDNFEVELPLIFDFFSSRITQNYRYNAIVPKKNLT